MKLFDMFFPKREERTQREIGDDLNSLAYGAIKSRQHSLALYMVREMLELPTGLEGAKKKSASEFVTRYCKDFVSMCDEVNWTDHKGYELSKDWLFNEAD